MRSLLGRLAEVWADPAVRGGILLITVAVGSLVTGARLVFDGRGPAVAWVAFFSVLPLVVFSLGAYSAGVRRITLLLVLRGLATVVIVAIAFSVINRQLEVPFAVRAVLNFVVPFLVSSLGAAAKE